MQNGYVRRPGFFAIKDIVDSVEALVQQRELRGPRQRATLQGAGEDGPGEEYEVNMDSPRLMRFAKEYAERGEIRCVRCGALASYFVAEGEPDRRPHLNLYGVEGNEELLFTVDHIEPVFTGGTRTVDNLQCMCEICNKRKGSLPDWIDVALPVRMPIESIRTSLGIPASTPALKAARAYLRTKLGGA